jgi:PAS domain-containing protein
MISASSQRSSEEYAVSVEGLLAELQLCPGVGVAILDDQLRFQAINSALAHMNGLPDIQHLGKTLADVLMCSGTSNIKCHRWLVKCWRADVFSCIATSLESCLHDARQDIG